MYALIVGALLTLHCPPINVHAFSSLPTTSLWNQRTLPSSYKSFPKHTLSDGNSMSNSFETSFRRQMFGYSVSSSTTSLSMNKKDDNDSENDSKSNTNFLPAPISQIITKLQTKFSDILPPFLMEYYAYLIQKLPTLKIAFISFLSGIFLAASAIIIPIYSQLDYLREPVTLFETILSDLDNGYVDKVDTNKLFETGVNAMLNSLDPYTEFEGRKEAVEMTESVSGKYAGVGLVISGSVEPDNDSMQKILDTEKGVDDDVDGTLDQEDIDEIVKENQIKLQKAREKIKNKGIRVMSAFEGYAFDYGMRVGDKLLSVDSTEITAGMSVEDVRNKLRGEPGTEVSIRFEREGVDGIQTVVIPRKVVTIRTVKLVTMLGKKEDAVGYVQLNGFAQDSGKEMRQAILYLQQQALLTSNGMTGLKGLVLDLRGNPGGLLTSAVDVSSLLVPKNSDIVSARGRGFPSVLYRSRVDPLVSPDTKLAVLVNGGTASAAEIVSGAVQDLDVGVVIGTDRTFGKGLVQNVEELPFETALKFTVAKYYTPSGRCIQSTNYKEGGGSGTSVANSGFQANKVREEEKTDFFTKGGRIVKDGGGIEADYKVAAPSASALEVTLLRSGVMNDFASDWSRKYQMNDNFEVTDDLYRDFQKYVNDKQASEDIQLDSLYAPQLRDLKRVLKKSGYKASQREVDTLQASILREVQRDFDKYKIDIKEDLGQAILARYLPESMLLERGLKNDVQVDAALKLLTSPGDNFDKILARDSSAKGTRMNELAMSPKDASNSFSTSLSEKDDQSMKVQLKF